jgi:NarL family two-component system response regulator LiaR
MSQRVRVLIVDDHEVVRDGLQLFLSEEHDQIEIVGQAANGAMAVALAAEQRPDVVLMDLVMPDMDGIETLRCLRAQGIESRVVVLTTFVDEERVRAAIEAGAVGYLLKDVGRAELLSAIRAASRGQPSLHPVAQRYLMKQVSTPPVASPLAMLTQRELEVLCLIAAGESNKSIARKLQLSIGTVKGHVSAILSKLQVNSRTQAALVAVEQGLPDAHLIPSDTGS